jgi:indoleamine 2,3-dioxygenase
MEKSIPPSFVYDTCLYLGRQPAIRSKQIPSVHGNFTLTQSQILPAQIAKPFLTVSSHLGLPPTATYAGLNLWNFTSTSPTQDLTSLSHLSTVHTFTSTPDESWFYLVSVAIEARGAGIIPVMLDAMDAVRANEPSILVSCLQKFAACIKDCGEILKRMYEHCDPEVFYHIIRPFLAGSKNMAAAGLPRGVFYDEGDGKGEWRCYSGGSNAQSSLIQFWDAVLGVKHVPTRVVVGKSPMGGEVKKEGGSGHGFLDVSFLFPSSFSWPRRIKA